MASNERRARSTLKLLFEKDVYSMKDVVMNVGTTDVAVVGRLEADTFVV